VESATFGLATPFRLRFLPPQAGERAEPSRDLAWVAFSWLAWFSARKRSRHSVRRAPAVGSSRLSIRPSRHTSTLVVLAIQ
jgi:hypothetical protein